MPDARALQTVARELHDAVFAYNQRILPWDAMNPAERESFTERARWLLERLDGPSAD
jgi:hypothetical protein